MNICLGDFVRNYCHAATQRGNPGPVLLAVVLFEAAENSWKPKVDTSTIPNMSITIIIIKRVQTVM